MTSTQPNPTQTLIHTPGWYPRAALPRVLYSCGVKKYNASKSPSLSGILGVPIFGVKSAALSHHPCTPGISICLFHPARITALEKIHNFTNIGSIPVTLIQQRCTPGISRFLFHRTSITAVLRSTMVFLPGPLLSLEVITLVRQKQNLYTTSSENHCPTEVHNSPISGPFLSL